MLRFPRPTSMNVVTGVIIATVALPSLGFVAYHHEVTKGKLPAHTVVGGVDVSGLHMAAALARVDSAVTARLDRPVVVRASGHTFRTTARDLGVTADVAKAVDLAFSEAAHRGTLVSRAWHSVFGGGAAPQVAVPMTDPVPARLNAFVGRIHDTEYVAAVDAAAEPAGAGLKFIPSATGHAVSRHAAQRAVLASLADGRVHTMRVHTVQPTVQDATFDTAILVHVNENKLYVYKHHKLVRTFPVATGTTQYPTPIGSFTVTLKRYMPTWYNPHSAWSIDEPETIPPGPSNPLGLRALNLSAPGIRIHGSPADYSIGYNASHGCIRMHNSDVIQLYPLIPTGTPVVISTYGAYHPL